MTHEELLAKVDKPYFFTEMLTESKVEIDKKIAALRAVVELHKQIYVETEGGEFQLCADCSRRVDIPGYGVTYPCKTIQAIESALQ